ncbi:hypothetical protein DFH29DRAFT_1084314 [Suillus ampliporus]|nr:hypothetical protein DFH29DRAFT_1084314 [Suillus ampliporus]
MMEERTKAGTEGEFGVSAGGSRALTPDNLFVLLASSSTLTAVKKSSKPLTFTKTKTLSTPLPQSTQERLDREAADEKTKEEVDKFGHLKQPSNALKSAVDNLLKSGLLRGQDIAGTEALTMAYLSIEEVATQGAELRMMREPAFRPYKKAKRIAKSRRKMYRRIRK